MEPTVSPGETAWQQLRPHLHVGQLLTGTVVWIPRPGTIGIGVDLNLPVGGFVDALLLPSDADHWPALQTVTNFHIWELDQRPQIRLICAEPQYHREDFDTWIIDHPTPSGHAFRNRPI